MLPLLMKTKFTRYSFLVIFSSLIGASFYFLSSIWAFLFCLLCMFAMFQKLKFTQEPRFVFIIILAAMLTRIVLVLFHTLLCYGLNVFDIIADAANYTSYGIYIAEVITEKAIFRMPSVLIRWQELSGLIPGFGRYQTTGLAYLQAIAYSAFGYSVLGIKIFNATIGVVIGIMAYYFLKQRIGVCSSVTVLFLVLFYPTLIIWSITGLKDMIVIFITLLFLTNLGKMINGEMKLKDITVKTFILGLFIIFVYTLRERMVYLYFFVFILSLFITFFVKVSRYKKACIFFTITFCVFLLNQNGFFRVNLNKIFRNTMLAQVAQYHEKGKTSYKIYPDRFYSDKTVDSVLKQQPLTKTEAVIASIKGIVYFIFAPLPMHLRMSKFLVLIYPQSLFTLMLFPFMLAGAIWSLRFYTLPFTPLFIFMVVYIIAGGLMSGNIGTSFRHKDLIMPIYLMFSAMGISLLFGRDKVVSRKDDEISASHLPNSSDNQKVPT